MAIVSILQQITFRRSSIVVHILSNGAKQSEFRTSPSLLNVYGSSRFIVRKEIQLLTESIEIKRRRRRRRYAVVIYLIKRTMVTKLFRNCLRLMNFAFLNFKLIGIGFIVTFFSYSSAMSKRCTAERWSAAARVTIIDRGTVQRSWAATHTHWNPTPRERLPLRVFHRRCGASDVIINESIIQQPSKRFVGCAVTTTMLR